MADEKIKSRLREEMKRRRDMIPADVRQEMSLAIARKLLSLPEYAKNNSFLVYSALRSEVSPAFFCEQAIRDGKRLYFPRVSGDGMEFYRITDRAQLERGSFSVMEPRVYSQEEENERSESAGLYAGERWNGKEAIVLVPGLVFSREGGRIGYGGGYYDRFLSENPQLTALGVCFASQITEDAALGLERHDRRMNRIVTESEVIT